MTTLNWLDYSLKSIPFEFRIEAEHLMQWGEIMLAKEEFINSLPNPYRTQTGSRFLRSYQFFRSWWLDWNGDLEALYATRYEATR